MIRAVLACAVLMLATACSRASGADAGAYARGVAAFESGKPATARVEFLNAIKADPGNGAARVMQARTYLALGDGVAAEAEIARSRQLGVSAPATAHLLAHALLLRNQPQQALDALSSAEPAHAAYAARLRGQALHALEDNGGASAAFDDALEAAPDDPLLWIAIGRFRRDGGDLAGALAAVDRAVALQPRSADALILRGELSRSQYGLVAALPWFDRALQIDPANVAALLERAATLGDMGRAAAMLADTRQVLSLSKDNPVAYYLQAMLAARAEKFDLARSLFQRSAGRFDDKPAGMLLAGAIDFQTGNVEQAVRRLDRLVALQPGNRKARRLLAAAYWRQGNARATIDTLRPIADRPDADSYALALTGQALTRLGDPEAASAYLARAAQPHRRAPTALAAAIGADELDALRNRAAAEPGDAPAQVRLIGGLLSNGIGGEALQRALQLQAANPGAPDAHVLVGDARSLAGDYRGAAEAYRKAANLAFTEPTAMRMIEALQRSGQMQAATQVLQLFLQQNPNNVPAQLLAAVRLMEAGDWGNAIRLYESLRRRLGDRDAVLLNNLALAYGQQADYDRAIPLARKAWSLDKRNPATADTYGWLLFKSGRDTARGLALLQRASRG